jgi:hypothetical protein
MGGVCNINWEQEGRIRLLVKKAEGKEHLGRSRSRFIDNIKMDLGKISWGDMH